MPFYGDDVEDKLAFKTKIRAVSEAFRNHPHNVIQKLEKLGFAYMTDGEDDKADIAEERSAHPANASQKSLVAYLDGTALPDAALLLLWLEETSGNNNPNYPLWRRYFRAGNTQLKTLLLYGLDQYPADSDLLNALAFLHIFSPMLKELIACYLKACDKEQNMERFAALARDFDNNTHNSGYEALMALRDRYPEDSVKTRCVKELLEISATSSEAISF